MNKIGTMLLAMISLLCITGCSSNKTKEYVFTDTPIEAQELIEMYQDSGECEHIYKNNQNGVDIILTEKQRIAMLHSDILEDPESINFPIGNIGPSVSFQNGFTELRIEGSKEEILAFEEPTKNYAFLAELQQVLNEQKNWKLEVILINSETDTLWHMFNLPEETLDWTLLPEE